MLINGAVLKLCMEEAIDYSNAKQLIGRTVRVKIDRAMGSTHPKHGFIYPVNYGYIEGIAAPDGDELDAYVIGVFEPVDEFEGTCIAMIERSDDDDRKMVVVPAGRDYTDEAILALVEFQERYFTPQVIRGE